MGAARPDDLRVEYHTPSDIWRLKDEMAESQRRSMEFWQQMDDDERAAVLLAVKDRMAWLTGRVETWVPASLDPTKGPGHRIDVTFSFELPAISPNGLMERLDAERAYAHTRNAFLEMARDLQRE